MEETFFTSQKCFEKYELRSKGSLLEFILWRRRKRSESSVETAGWLIKPL